MLAAGCTKPYLGVNIPFVATWGDRPISCENSEIVISDLRFYVSSVQLVSTDGHLQDLELHADIPWQQPDLALIDLENEQGACDNGTPATSPYLVGGAPPGEYQALRFTVGVPFDRNHADPLAASAPLDDPAMHWHWRSGYKFLRAGVKTANDSFWIHVGSAGCEGTVRDIRGCRFPNRITVELENFEPNADTIGIDLRELFAGIDLHDGVPGDCSSGPAETQCIAPFAALGIDFETGKGTGPQRIFSVR